MEFPSWKIEYRYKFQVGTELEYSENFVGMDCRSLASDMIIKDFAAVILKTVYKVSHEEALEKASKLFDEKKLQKLFD